MNAGPLLQAKDLVRTFGGGRSLLGARRPAVHALRGVSFEVTRAETLGIVGESGCGKTTLARIIVSLDAPTTGEVVLKQGEKGSRLSRVQYVFQDPVAALNPRKRVRDALAVPLVNLAKLSGSAREDRLEELMDLVNLDPAFLERYPHELSGGQAQRVGLARALAASPELIVLDEPVSALDVSMQAQVLDLLAELKRRLGLTYIFISHDLAVVETVSDRVAILYFGKLVEVGRARDVYGAAKHPYTRLLLSCAPAPARRLSAPADAHAELPDPYDPPQGCAFAARCPKAQDICRETDPPLEPDGADASHRAACHFPMA